MSESEGPGIWYLANVDCGFAPFELHKIEAADFGAGPGEAGDLERFDFSTGLAEHGPEFFELMRSRKAPSPVNPNGPWLYGIGGALDHTVISAEGVSTTRLRTWPDFLGLARNSCCSGGGQNGGLEGVVGINWVSRRVRKLADASQSPMARLNDIFGPVERSVRRK